MQRVLLIIASAIVLALGLFQFGSGLLDLFPGLRADSQVSAAAKDALEAASNFNALAKDSYQTGNVPRQTDPAAKLLLDKVFATNVLASKQLSKSDLGAMGDWNNAVVMVGGAYIFSGTGLSDPSKATDDPKLVEKVNQNVVTYAPELGRYIDAELAVMGGMIDAVNASVPDGKPANAEVQSGMARVRGGVAATLTGVLSTMVTPGLSDDWRRERLSGLNSVAPRAAKLLLPDQCRALRDTAVEAAQALSDPSAQAGLKSFSASLQCQS